MEGYVKSFQIKYFDQMSNSNEILEKSSKCKTFSSSSNFFKDNTKKHGYRPSCKLCCQKYYYNNQNRILNNHKIYIKKNRSKINTYERQRRKTDFIFRLICNIRRGTNLAFKSQNIRKTNKIIDFMFPGLFKKMDLSSTIW